MALNDVALVNRALIRLGAAPIGAFSDSSAEAEIANALYEPVRDALISAYPWTFATGQETLNQLVDGPAGDYTYAYELPSDFLRVLSAGTGGRGRGIDFRIMRGNLHTDVNSVLLTYIFSPDESEFPPYFDIALIARLSAEFCIPITESTSRAEAMYRLAEDEFGRARSIDSQQDTPARLEDFSLIDVR